MLELFPFCEGDLMPVSRFVSYCKDRGIKVKRDDLEFFHKIGLLIPCLRITPGVNQFKKYHSNEKQNLKEVFIPMESFDGSEFNAADSHTYYGYAGFSYGGPGWLKFYEKNDLVENPYEDKKFMEWSEYSLRAPDFSKKVSDYANYRILLYSKYQIHLLKELLDKRPYKVTFINKPSDKLLKKVKILADEHLRIFDESYVKRYEEFINFLKKYKFIIKFKNEIDLMIHDRIDKFAIAEQSNFQDRVKEYKLERKGITETKEFSDGLKKACSELMNENDFDAKWLVQWREKIFLRSIKSSEDMVFFQIIKDKKLSKFRRKGKMQFMIDCFEISKDIEWLLDSIGYDSYETFQRLFFHFDSSLCFICGSDLPVKRKKYCSEKCLQAGKNKMKRSKRKKGIYS